LERYVCNIGRRRRLPDVRTVTDPRALRALAHPLRLTLLDLLDREGELTATRAAELTGESSANCSFHLRQLGKREFIEPAEAADRRERPWRRVAAGVRVPVTDDPALLRASASVGRLVVERVAVEAGEFLDLRAHDDLGWQDASLLTVETFHLTRDELHDLSREIAAVLESRIAARSAGGGSADLETRPVRVAGLVFPLPRR
jgi:DNA-binding transcriptional ArsR family regulator